MSSAIINPSQRKAASVVGFLYLFAMAASVFSEAYVRGSLVVANDAATTAQNIMAHERLFRLGIASELITFICTLGLLTALYVILKPINRNLALFAVFSRMVEAIICVVMTLSSLEVLRLLSGADYLRIFEEDQLQAMARQCIAAHGAAYGVAFVFLGLGSAVFSYLWLKSKYIPAALAALGIFASSLLGTGSLAFIIFPELSKIIYPAYMAPMGVFEVTMGFWLLIKGLSGSSVAEPALQAAH
jgi:Domain of unknown function (DUF4386)